MENRDREIRRQIDGLISSAGTELVAQQIRFRRKFAIVLEVVIIAVGVD